MAFYTSLQRQHSELISKFEVQELEINRLKVRVHLLKDREGLVRERHGYDTPIKGRNLDEGEAAAKRVSDDIKEMETVLTSMDAATILASGVDDVPICSGSIPTASPPAAEVPTSSDVVPTTSPVFTTATVVTPYRRKKGKEIIVETETPKKKKVQEQIDAQVARDLEEQMAREDQRMSEHGEGSGTPTKPHHTPSLEVTSSHPSTSSIPLPSIPTAPIPPVPQTGTTPIIQYTRRARIAQSSALPTVADEPASPVTDDSQGEACPTDSGFEADQDRANIAKTSTLPYDSAPRVTSLVAAKGSMQQSLNELTAFCTSLGSILTASPPAAEVPTGSDVVPTASPIFATATVVTPYRRRKGKEIMVESENPKKKKVQEQIDAQVARDLEEKMAREDQRMSKQVARDAEIARIHAEEELQSMIDGLDRSNETIAKYLQEYQQFALELPLERRIELISDLVRYQDNYAKVYKYQSQQRKPWSKKQKRDYYMAVIRSNLGWKVKDFRGMTFEEIEEEAERLKRKGLSLEQESANKLKTSDEVLEEVKSPNEVPEEKVKEMMQLVPIEEVYVKVLQVKHPIIDSEVHTEDHRSYWKIIRLRGSSASYQFFVDLLKHIDRKDLNQLWALVKEYLSNRKPTSDKEMKLWVELKRLYEPDDKDQLWTHTQNLMHAPVEWKLYDMCGVHQVTSKDKEIFMLVEKDYPLRKGLTLVMICYKLQVENYSQMANNMILKIYKIANYPSQQSD
nr:hypothetical protein [Tanacetum cinerariifolium]